MNDYPWFEALNPVRRAAVLELALTGRMTPDIVAAVRDEHFAHAAGLVLSGVTEHRQDAAQLARAIETGQKQ